MFKYSNAADPDPEAVKNGIVVLPKGISYISARPILNYDEKAPSRGTMIFSKYIGQNAKADLASVTHLDVDLYTANDKNTPRDAPVVKTEL